MLIDELRVGFEGEPEFEPGLIDFVWSVVLSFWLQDVGHHPASQLSHGFLVHSRSLLFHANGQLTGWAMQ